MFILSCFILCCSSVSMAQDLGKKISLTCKDMTVSEALNRVERQSDFKLNFNYEELSRYRVNVVIQKKTAPDAVDILLENTPFKKTVTSNFIVISRQRKVVQQHQVQGTSTSRIHGKVMDKDRNPLPGVNVMVKGYDFGATTNGDGSYVLEIGNDVKTATLFYSFIGMKTVVQNVKMNSADKQVDIIMEENANELGEVVVNGIYTRKKESFTGSSSTFTDKEIKMIGNGNVLESLKTLDPSFAIIENNTFGSDPNQTLNVEIRGKTSVIGLTEEYGTDPNQPLFILDGFESSLSTISDLSMDRVQSITILKDASATAIYGSKAANGVVVVETKAPKSGKLKVNYNGNLNLTFADLSDYNLMNASEKLQFELLTGLYNTVGKDGYIANINDERKYNMRLAEVQRGVNTYWLNEPLQFAVSHRHNVFVEGGDGTMRYGAGVNYGKTEGVMKGSGRELVNGNIRLIYRKGRLAFTNTLNLDYSRADRETVAFSKFSQANPYYRKYDENGEPLQTLESFSYLDLSSFSIKTVNVYSPLYDWSNNNFNFTKTMGFTNNFEADWRAVDELRIRAKLGFGKSNEQSEKFSSPYNVAYIGMDSNKKGEYTESNKNSWNYDGDLSLTYGKLVAEHHMINAVAGMRFTQSTYELSGYTMRGFIDDEFTNPSFAQEYNTDNKVYQNIKRRTASYYLNAGYAYDNRYLLDFSWRSDGASVFGVNKLFTNTWSLGLGWNIHKEAFMKNVKWITLLKLRASIGNPGNQNFDDYISMKVYQYNNTHTNPWGTSAIIKNFGNSNLEWQKTLDRNIGFDLAMFKDRLRVNFDLFSKKTDPLLVYIGLPTSTGATQMPTNVGKQLTKGYTIQGNYYIIKDKDFLWSVNANLRHLTSEYQDVSQYLSKFNTANQSKNLLRYYDGGSPSDLWAVRSAGIDPATGREIFIRKDGTQTFTHSYDDEVVVGNSDPDIEGVVGTSFYYKGFSFSANFRYRLGGQIFMTTLYNKVENISTEDAHYNQDKRALYSRWKQPGDNAKFKAISSTEYTPMSSRFVEDNDIFSGESISLGYESQASWLKYIGASSLTARVYMNDIFRISTVKDERGLDYPFARSVSMSLGLRF
jgi:TonB-linked SusC/RagA family outer membrane protein